MSKELVVHDDIDSDIRLANALAQSGFYKDIRDAAAGVVKLRIARELGLGLKGISDVHIVEGKPTLSYQAILGMVRVYTGPLGTDRYSFRYKRRDEECVEIEWIINDEVIGSSKCDTADAKRMGVDGRHTWKKYPRQMRTARAVTEGVNAFMPEVIGGSIYTPDELGSGDSDAVVVVADNDEGGGRNTLQVASSPTAPAPSLTLKAVESSDDRADQMVAEAVETMDAAEETVDGEVIDPKPTWISALKDFFAENKDRRVEYVKLLRAEGYLPDGKLTQAQFYDALADSIGPRSLEMSILISELEG